MKSSIIYLLLIISFFSCSDKKNITQLWGLKRSDKIDME